MNGPIAISHSDAGVQGSATKKVLSCTSCRQRKVKCNKAHPCNHCEKSGSECVYPHRRTKTPRTRRRGQEELLQRITRLETLLSETANAMLESSDTAPTHQQRSEESSAPSPPQRSYNDRARPSSVSTASSVSSPQRFEDAFALAGTHIADRYGFYIKMQNSIGRNPSREFWSSLGDEFQGLKALLEDPGDEDSDEAEDTLSSPGTIDLMRPSSTFLFNNNHDTAESLKTAYPPDEKRTLLLDTFFENVNPVCMFSHRPTAYAHLAAFRELTDPATERLRFPSLEAVNFSVWFCAVTSMTNEECMTRLGESRDVLVDRYKRATEIALVESDFLNSMELVTLKAFNMYIMALRSHDKSRTSWSLIGLAVRIARGLGLDRDGESTNMAPFEAESRSRLWWSILVLDMRFSEDRGTEPCILDGTFNTRFPRNLHDEDFGAFSEYLPPNRRGITEMTLTLILMDASNTTRQLNFMGPVNNSTTLTLAQKEEIVKKCSDRIENKYLAGADISNRKTWLACMYGRLCILKLWLIVQYPLQSQGAASQDYPRGQSLRTVVALLTIAEMIDTHEYAAGHRWLFNTYAPWHPLAVALAELCVETTGSIADKAWGLIDRNYEKWSERVADHKSSKNWHPIKTLLKRAREARQQALVLESLNMTTIAPTTIPSLPNADIMTSMPNLSLQDQTIPTSIPANAMDMQTLNLLHQEFDPFDNFHLFCPGDTTRLNTDQFNLADNTNWDTWNQFIGDVNAPEMDIPTDLYGEWPMQI